MKKIGVKGSKVLKIFHLLFAIMWIGGGFALVALLFLTKPQSGDELYMRSLVLQVIDYYVLIPGAIATLLTGVVYGVWTNWGFFKHKWIVVKWILAVAQVVFGTFALGRWIDENVEIANRLRDQTLTDELFVSNLHNSALFGAIQVVILISYIVISVLKPWRKKRAKAE